MGMKIDKEKKQKERQVKNKQELKKKSILFKVWPAKPKLLCTFPLGVKFQNWEANPIKLRQCKSE